MWITCGLLWCFYQLFDSHSDGTHSLQRIHWFSSRSKLIYILDNLRVSKYVANFHFWVNYSFKWKQIYMNMQCHINELLKNNLNNNNNEKTLQKQCFWWEWVRKWELCYINKQKKSCVFHPFIKMFSTRIKSDKYTYKTKPYNLNIICSIYCVLHNVYSMKLIFT